MNGCGFIAPNLLAPNLIPPTEKKSSFRCRETVSSFSVTAPLSLFQRGLGGDRAVRGESNLAPHPATDDPPLQQGELSTAQGEATRDRQSVYSHKGRVRAYGVRRLMITTNDGTKY
ncbi:hypothetical protein J6590_095355 [Homalodisca vitripennis]|nr:hypothetical protein J6590_095355 [Homalodisca vitripennis]